MSVREEIEAAVGRLALLPEQFADVSEDEARRLFDTFLSHFTGDINARWWWEHFTLPTSTVRFADGKAFTRIMDMVPDTKERVWFVAEDDQAPFFPVYEATPAAAQEVIGECYGFEYYLIAKDLTWLLCENHHDTMIGVGEAIRSRMAKAGP